MTALVHVIIAAIVVLGAMGVTTTICNCVGQVFRLDHEHKKAELEAKQLKEYEVREVVRSELILQEGLRALSSGKLQHRS